MSRMEIIVRDSDYGRANQIPMTHPRLARLDSNPPEEWYITTRQPGRGGVLQTLAESALASNYAIQGKSADLTRATPAMVESKRQQLDRIEARRRMVLSALSDKPMLTRAVTAATGLTKDMTDRALRQLERVGLVECMDGVNPANGCKVYLWRRTERAGDSQN